MANKSLPSARPVAPGVDPAEPARTPDPATPTLPDNVPDGDHVTKTQDTKTLNQQDAPAAPDAQPLSQNEQSLVATKQDDPRAYTGNGATAEVATVTVRTKEAILLMDPYSARHIDNSEAGTEVPVTSFINDELAEGGRLEKA